MLRYIGSLLVNVAEILVEQFVPLDRDKNFALPPMTGKKMAEFMLRCLLWWWLVSSALIAASFIANQRSIYVRICGALSLVVSVILLLFDLGIPYWSLWIVCYLSTEFFMISDINSSSSFEKFRVSNYTLLTVFFLPVTLVSFIRIFV